MFIGTRRLMCFLFFKQKTAYGMRISDWSSDVCSSDLNAHTRAARGGVRAADRSGENPALDGHRGAARAAARRTLSRQRHRGPLRSRLLPQGGAGAPPGLQLRSSEEHKSALQLLLRISYAVFCLQQKKTTNTVTYKC